MKFIRGQRSTLIRILAGELPLQEGTLMLGEKRITGEMSCDFSGSVEYMAQIPVVIDGTVRENILMGKPMDQEKFKRAVKNAGLENLLRKFSNGDQTRISPDTLSSGEKQKIAIARVFYQEKPVWIFDEPTSALDPAAMTIVLRGMEEYANRH